MCIKPTFLLRQYNILFTIWTTVTWFFFWRMYNIVLYMYETEFLSNPEYSPSPLQEPTG
jgi:hypothetical protein